MSRYFPSMKKHSWIILTCLLITLVAGFTLSKAQPTVYQVNSTLIVDANAPGTSLSSGVGSTSDSISQSMADASEIPTRLVMSFVYQSDPNIRAHGFTADDLSSDITAMNPSPTSPTIIITATANHPADAVLLVNDVAKGYQAYKTKQMQDQLNLIRQNLQAEYAQFKSQSDALEKQIQSLGSSTDPRIALYTADRASILTSMNAVQNQMIQLPTAVHSNVFILQPATITDVSSTSKASLILAVSGGVGLLVGILIWLLVIFLDNRLRAEDQVTEKLGLNYLGSLANDKDIQPGSILSSGDVAQQLSDIGVNLRLTGVLPGQWRAPQGAVLLVTSAQPVEGKTTLAVGLAASIAHSGRSVLVIDGNLHEPTTHLAFHMSPASFGLSGILRGSGGENVDAAIQRSNLPGVWLLAGGSKMDDASILLEQKLPAILAQLRKKTDWIIIDGPSILSGSDASLLASMADGVALVVDARHDKVAILLRAKEVLRSLTHTPIGVIINRQPRPRRNPYYAATFSTETVSDAGIPAQAFTSNGHDVTNGQRPEPVVAQQSGTSPNQYGAPVAPGRPVAAMPMDLPVMQPNVNPPTPFPVTRRMDMTPPQS